MDKPSDDTELDDLPVMELTAPVANEYRELDREWLAECFERASADRAQTGWKPRRR